jgi:hypothetical protein
MSSSAPSLARAHSLNELWLDMALLNRFLNEILAAGGPTREHITAYANKTRGAELETEVLESYKKASLTRM